MAQFIKMGPAQAGDIDSESATAGQVLTADGAGAAAWQDAAQTTGATGTFVDGNGNTVTVVNGLITVLITLWQFDFSSADHLAYMAIF